MPHDAERDILEPLTPREQDVLELLRLGLTDAQIAQRLDVSTSAIRRHVSQLIAKLGVRNRYEAAAWPERPPWWATALAPVALFWRKAGAALPVQPSSIATVLSGGLFVAALGGLGLMAFLVLRSGDAGATIDETAAVDAPASRVLSLPPDLSALAAPRPLSAPAPLSPPSTPLPTATSEPARPPTATFTPTALSPPATPTSTPAPGLTPAPTPVSTSTPIPTATDTDVCPLCDVWLFVYFAPGVTYDRATAIVEEVGASIIPIAFLVPLCLIEGAESVEVVGVPIGEELEFAERLEEYDEVVAAKTDWLDCGAGTLPPSG